MTSGKASRSHKVEDRRMRTFWKSYWWKGIAGCLLDESLADGGNVLSVFVISFLLFFEIHDASLLLGTSCASRRSTYALVIFDSTRWNELLSFLFIFQVEFFVSNFSRFPQWWVTVDVRFFLQLSCKWLLKTFSTNFFESYISFF